MKHLLQPSGGRELLIAECGRGLSFALKAGECVRVSGNFMRQELEGDEAVQPRVLSLIDHAHPATAELLDDEVMRDGLADHG